MSATTAAMGNILSHLCHAQMASLKSTMAWAKSQLEVERELHLRQT